MVPNSQFPAGEKHVTWTQGSRWIRAGSLPHLQMITHEGVFQGKRRGRKPLVQVSGSKNNSTVSPGQVVAWHPWPPTPHKNGVLMEERYTLAINQCFLILLQCMLHASRVLLDVRSVVFPTCKQFIIHHLLTSPPRYRSMIIHGCRGSLVVKPSVTWCN